MNRMAFFLLISLILGLGGCGVKQAASPSAVSYQLSRSRADSAQGGHAGSQTSAAASEEAVFTSLVQADNAAPAPTRKIIYNGDVTLVVENFDQVDSRINELAAEFDGFIAQFREDRNYGEQRAGQWTIRIPADQFTQFMDQVVELGVAESRQVNADDVTEEYVDLEARLANQRRIEERLLKLLEEQAGELEHVIELEVKLGEVREQIERLEGRLRYLSDRVTLATLTISAREERGYTPPQAPTFTAKIGASFFNSLDGLKQFGQQLVLILVVLAPWAVVGAVVLGPLGILWRRRRSRA